MRPGPSAGGKIWKDGRKVYHWQSGPDAVPDFYSSFRDNRAVASRNPSPLLSGPDRRPFERGHLRIDRARTENPPRGGPDGQKVHVFRFFKGSSRTGAFSPPGYRFAPESGGVVQGKRLCRIVKIRY